MKRACVTTICICLGLLYLTGSAEAGLTHVQDSFGQDLMLTNAYQSRNPLKGTFDLASTLGVGVSELQDYRILSGSAVFHFMDDGDNFTTTLTSVGDYRDTGQIDPETGKKIYIRGESWGQLNDTEGEVHGVIFAGESATVESPDHFGGVVKRELIRDYPPTTWTYYDPDVMYYTEREIYWSGKTGPNQAEFTLDQADMDLLLSQGYLDFWLYTVRLFTPIYTEPWGYSLPNDTIFKGATLTLDMERIEPVQVPVPGAAFLGLLGLGSGWLIRRRRRPAQL